MEREMSGHYGTFAESEITDIANQINLMDQPTLTELFSQLKVRTIKECIRVASKIGAA